MSLMQDGQRHLLLEVSYGDFSSPTTYTEYLLQKELEVAPQELSKRLRRDAEEATRPTYLRLARDVPAASKSVSGKANLWME
jgi:hypothetical protein